MRKQASIPESASPMAVTPIPKLLASLGIPLICSLVVQACYNIVDSYFVSAMKDTPGITGMGDYAMNALTLAFPIQMLIVALGVGTGVGVNALLARSMGQGDREKAGKVAGNGLFLGVCIYILFLLFGLVGVGPYLRTQTSDPLVLELADCYLTICCVYSFGQVLFTIYEKLLQATGHAVLSTIAQVSGALTNIILDPILIFGYFGAPELGVAGAAYATVIGQVVSLILYMVFQYTCNREVPAGLCYWIPEGKILKEILSVGFPAIIMQAVGSFLTYGVNVIFGALSASAVTAYGVYYKIQQFAFFAAFGMNNAMIPVIAFNYGSGDQKRVQEGIRWGMRYTLLIMGVCLVVLEGCANQIMEIFALTEETLTLCVRAARIIALGYLFAGANIAYQGTFQALGRGVPSMLLCLVRQLIAALPLAWALTLLPHPEVWCWVAFPLAEGIGLVVAKAFAASYGISNRKTAH